MANGVRRCPLSAPEPKLRLPLPRQQEGHRTTGISGMGGEIGADGQNFALKTEVARLLSSQPTRMPSYIYRCYKPGIPIHSDLTRIADHAVQLCCGLRICCRWQPVACCGDGYQPPFGSEDKPSLRPSSPWFGDLAGIFPLHSQRQQTPGANQPFIHLRSSPQYLNSIKNNIAENGWIEHRAGEG